LLTARRRDSNYQGWKLHVWGDVAAPTVWGAGLTPTGLTAGGPFWAVQLKPHATHVGLIVYRGDSTSGEEKAAGVVC
jgi:hypothetical protein